MTGQMLGEWKNIIMLVGIEPDVKLFYVMEIGSKQSQRTYELFCPTRRGIMG